MGYFSLHLHLFLLLAFTAAVKSQQTTCFVAATCDTSQPSETIQSSDAVGVCCNYPSAGVNPRGFAYRVGQGACTACPLIFGFFNTTFSAEESSIATSLPIGYLSGAPPTSFAGVNLQVQGITASPNDFTVTGAVNGAGQFALNTGQLFVDVSVQHTIDGVAQEREEQYSITLSNFINLGAYTFVGTTGTIIDTDRVTFFFSEADHSINEGSLPAPPTIIAPLSKNADTRLANPVIFQVSPVTIYKANDTGCPIPPGAQLVFDPNSPFKAIDADFNTTSFTVTFPADEGSATVFNSIDSIRVAVEDDDINERFEQLFLIKVEVVEALNPSTIDITRGTTIGIIVDNDPLVIGFNQSSWTFDEPERLVREQIYLAKEKNRTTEQTFDVRINLRTVAGVISSATEGEDYATDLIDGTTVRVFPASQQERIALNLRLFPDNIAEGNEGFILTSTPTGGLRYTLPTQLSCVYRTETVVIRDNDAIVIGFEEPVYTVNEGESVTVCINVTNPPVEDSLSLSATLFLSGTHISGTASSSDYSGTIFYLVSSSEANMPEARYFCVPVTAEADGILENTEYFDIALNFAAPSQDLVILQPNLTQVQIISMDVATIGFIDAPYYVNETAGIATLTIGVINGTIDVSVSLNVQLQDGSAVASDDYGATLSSSTVTIDSSTSTVDITFPIVDDSFYELAENLFAVLSFAPGGGNSMVVLSPNRAQVNILDDDGLTFGFQQTTYTFTEGAGLQDTIVTLLDGSLRNVAVTLAAETRPLMVGEIAKSGEDYEPANSSSLLFDDNTLLEPFQVRILQDNLTERTESFSAALTRVVSISVGGVQADFTEMDTNRILFSPSTTRINILDDDVTTIGFRPVNYMADEDAGPITFMFGVLDGTLGFAVGFEFITANGTAFEGVDFAPLKATYTINGMDRNSAAVGLIDDDILEGEEIFTASLFPVGLLSSNIVFDPIEASAVIIDNDDIVIGFVPDVYTVTEGGMVNFNVTVISGTLTGNIVVEFFTSDGDATAPADYTSTTMTLTFNMSSPFQIVPVMVMNDGLFEYEEVFFGNLTLPAGTTSNIRLIPPMATVAITDNDAAVIGFSRNYTVTEGGTVNLELEVLSGNLGREVEVSVSTADGTAQAPGDYASVVSRLVTFAPGQTNAFVLVASNADNTVEFNEYFTARATLVSTDAAVTINPEITFVNIEDNDGVVIGFVPDTYSVFEPERIVTLTASVLSGMLARPVQVSFFTTDGTATSTSPEDYIAVSNLVLEFDAATLSRQINISILNDDILENDEVFYGNLSTSDGAVQINPAAATVNILEAPGDDAVTIGFRPQNYTVNEEDGSVTLIILLISGTLERDVIVPFFTSSGTATEEDPRDYQGLSTLLTFTPSNDMRTVNVVLFDDTIVEGSEFFNGNINGSNLVNASPNRATVIVNENITTDRITVGFNPDAYTVNEADGSVTLSAQILSGMLERSAVVNFFTTDGSATSADPMDYMEESGSLVFDANTGVQQIAVSIINDSAVENSESFYGNLSTSDVAVDLAPNAARVTIVEVPGEDVVQIGFTQTLFTVMEDSGPVEVCVALFSMQTLLERDAVVMLQTMDGTAVYPEDYTSITERITFSPTSDPIVCINVSIANDVISEGPQQFGAVLTTMDNSVALSPEMATIEIDDEDDITIGFDRTRDSVSENAASITVFVEVKDNGMLQRSVVVIYNTPMSAGNTATSGVDFEATSGQLIFDSTTTVLSFPVTILNDTLAEGPEEFLLQLTTTEQRVILDPPQMDVEIIDDDVVTIGFLRSSYTGSESDGYVTLTVGVTNGQLQRDFIVILTNEDRNVTNTATAPADYQSFSVDLTFSSTTNRTDFNVSLTDDTITENREEFLATLSAVTSDTAAVVSPRIAEVFIVDNDRITVGFAPDSYAVNETDGTVTLTVMILGGTLDRSAIVNFFTTDGTATSVAPMDFIRVTQTSIVFNAGTTSQQVTVSIADDDIVEDSEFFYGNLSTSDGAVILDPSAARVTILETEGDDSIRVGFDPDSYMVNETDGTVTLTIKVIEGTLERNAVVSFSTTDGSATSTVPADFNAVSDQLFTFSPSTSSNDVTVTIIDDDIVENSEFFFGNLSTTDGAVNLDPSAARVTISETEGDDSIRVGFDPDSYIVNEEDGDVTLTIRILEGTLERDAVVFFSTTDGSATSTDPADFTAVTNEPVTFSSSINSNEVTVTIVDDEAVESIEVFYGNLSTSDSAIDLLPASAVVTINASLPSEVDTITVGMDQVRVVVNEDIGTVQLCASVMRGVLERQAVVTVIYENRGAMGGSDYIENNAQLIFSPGITRQCFNVSIINDESFENVEEFFVNLTTTDPLVLLSPVFTTVAIMDDDVIIIGWEQTLYVVNESVGLVELCAVAEVNGRPGGAIQATIPSILIILQNGSAVSENDYGSNPMPNSFNFNRQSGPFLCTMVTIVPDDALEGGAENFFARLDSPSNSRVILDPERTEVLITDDDVVVIGFGRTNVTVPENLMTFMVCVVIQGNAAININVSIASQPVSALPGDDYTPSQIPSLLFIPAGQMQVCFNSTAIVDDTNQEPTESFMLVITATDPMNDLIVVDPSATTITIIDNDDSGVRVNDTVIGDPLYTVPMRVPQEQLDALNLNKLSLCYEIHGKSEQWFNLVTDNCASVNTRYAMLSPRLNIMDAIAVRAVDEVDQCVNIRVDVAECTAMVGSNSLDVMSKYELNGIMVKRYRNRVRISVPNCQDLTLVMWVICENRTLENPDSPGSMLTSKMIKFVVMRGLNFGHRQAHGLLGQFWNIPVSIAPYTGLLSNGDPAVSRYVVNITTSGVTRSYTGLMHTSTWDHSEGPCLFVGNRQSGPIAEVRDPNDPVIESLYTNYEVKEPFSEDEDYKFRMFDESRCTAGPIMN